MSHHYSGPDFGFPQGDARLDFMISVHFRNRETLGNPVAIQCETRRGSWILSFSVQSAPGLKELRQRVGRLSCVLLQNPVTRILEHNHRHISRHRLHLRSEDLAQ